MGGFYSMLSDCFKKKELETPILNIDGIYDDNNVLTRLSDLIDNKQVQWSSCDSRAEQEYFRMINDAAYLRKKYRNEYL
jgi:hypothetical protein